MAYLSFPEGEKNEAIQHDQPQYPSHKKRKKKKKRQALILIPRSASTKVCGSVGAGKDHIHMLVQDLVLYYYHMYTGHQTPVLKLGSKCVSPLRYNTII